MPWKQNPDTGESYWVEDAAPPQPATNKPGPVPAYGGDTSHIRDAPAIPNVYTPLPGTVDYDPTGRSLPPANPPPGLAAPPPAPAPPVVEDVPASPELDTTGTEQGPAEVDRAKIDALLGIVNTATSGLLGIATNRDEFSAAQAQLAIGTEQAQRAALGQARSGNQRDRAQLERTAIAEGATLASDATRSAAVLRAQEEEANRKLRLDAFSKAGDLGLNASALEVDVNRLNMSAATDYLNQLFENNRMQLQIDQAEAVRITNFVRDMALIAKDYYALSQDEKQSIRDDMTRRYGISEQARTAMAQLDAQPGFWEQAALGLVQAAPGAVATIATGKPPTTSDRRAKTNIADTTEADLEELLAAVKSQTYEYKDPGKHGTGRQLGQMAQDLQKSKLGASMVSNSGDGTLQVDDGKAGLAALSGLALVFEKLKELEAGL